MAVLLLRLAGPMQSWGSGDKFEIRRTELAPTKSGIVGLMASAMGIGRDESIDDLSRLSVGVRIDDPGTVIKDFHTARSEKTSYISTRYYLSDAVFLAGIEGPVEQLREIYQAILHPAHPLYLGRRSCPPCLPIALEIVDGDLRNVLKDYPWQAELSPELAFPKMEYQRKNTRVKRIMNKYGTVNQEGAQREFTSRIILDSDVFAQGQLVRDQPKSFSPKKREYRYRSIQGDTISFSVPYQLDRQSDESTLSDHFEHDPLAELEAYQ